MMFGFMNSEDKKFYDQQMFELLKDKMDANGRVSKEDWRIADRIVTNMIKAMGKGGLF